MTAKVYDNLHEKHANLHISDDLIRLNEEFDDHADKLQAMVTLALTHDNFTDQDKLTCHSYFCLLENEIKQLNKVKNKLFATIHHIK